MPAVSKKQQRFFGMVDAGKIPKPKGMKDEDVKKFARTKHKGLPEQVGESYTIKELIEGMTLSSFLIVEAMPAMDPNTTRGYIRSLEQYQELMKDQENKGTALKLARNMVDEFGDGPLDDNTKNYIFDQFDELSQRVYKGRTSVGDWEGEAEYQERMADDEALASAMDKWEQATGMDAETGEELPQKKQRMKRGATHQKGKFEKARREMAAFADAPAPEQADRLAAARTQADIAATPARGNKMDQARAIFDEEYGTSKPSAIIRRMMAEVADGISKQMATTYYYKLKKRAAQQG